MGNLIQLICDYGPNDMAWAEVTAAFMGALPDGWHLHCTTVPPFDTIATGFIVSQLCVAQPPLRPRNLFVFANTAPRKDNLKARENNEGEGLLYGRLKNGVQLVAVNSGFSMSFVKNEIDELWSTTAEDGGSQFRSRDFFPSVVGTILIGDKKDLVHKLDPKEVIPNPPSHLIGYIDSFGNIKTTIRGSDPQIAAMSPGDRIKIRIGRYIRTATVATGSFAISEGDLAFAPGSSGGDDRFWEIFQRGGSAANEFGHPTNGSTIYFL